jgi:Na+/H+ antiporter NhaB
MRLVALVQFCVSRFTNAFLLAAVVVSVVVSVYAEFFSAPKAVLHPGAHQ